MGILDILIIILISIFVIIGMIKGFTRQTLSSFAWLIALGVGVFLCKTVASLIENTNLGFSLTNTISTWITKKGGEAVTVVSPTITDELLGDALHSLGIPYVFHPFLIDHIDISEAQNISIVSYVAPKITSFVLIIICFLVIYLIVFLLVKLLSKILGDAIKNSPFSFLDRILGMIWGCLKGILVASVLMLIVSMVMSLPVQSINDWLIADMKLNTEDFGIAKFIYEHNPILIAITYFRGK